MFRQKNTRCGLKSKADFLEGSWNRKFPSVRGLIKRDDLKKYAYEEFKKEIGYWQAFILGYSVFLQSDIDAQTPFWHLKFHEAMIERKEYEESKPTKVIVTGYEGK
ncbi:MAG: hypothetical protein K8R21_07915 [Leptospira sp.]|nr:hypothetical protein [Leptospira sp.]